MNRTELSFKNRDPAKYDKLILQVTGNDFNDSNKELHEMMLELYSILRDKLSIFVFDCEYEISNKHGWVEILSSKDRAHDGYLLVISAVHKPNCQPLKPQSFAEVKKNRITFDDVIKEGKLVHEEYVHIVDSMVRGLFTTFVKTHNFHVEVTSEGLMSVRFLPHHAQYALQILTRSMDSVIDEEFRTRDYHKKHGREDQLVTHVTH